MSQVDIFALYPPEYLQIFIVAMIVAVVLEMGYDFIAGKKLEYTRTSRRALLGSMKKGVKPVSGAVRAGPVMGAIWDILASRQLASCGRGKRISHLLMFWGFVPFVITAAVMVFFFPHGYNFGAEVILSITSTMLLAGSIISLFYRVDVRYEGRPVYSFRRADVFVLNLIVIAALSLVFEGAIYAGYVFLASASIAAFLAASTFLFVSTLWTKLPHMFYKGGLIFQDRIDSSRGIMRASVMSQIIAKEGEN